jgi:ribose transport system substrate-binding protein
LVRGVDALILSPVEDAGLRSATRRAYERAGVPVIVLDRDVGSGKTLFIGQSNFSMAASVAEVMIEKLRELHGDPRGQIVVITGLLGSTPAIDRHEGFLSVMEKHPEVKVLATGDGQWIREPAVRLMEDWLVRFPRIDAIFSHAEESSWGAQLAIERAGRANQNILHFTHDGSNFGFCSVKSGLFQADGNYTPYLGQVGVRAALYALMGEELPAVEAYEHGHRLQLPDLPVVTPGNVDEWLGRGWGDWNPATCERYAIP